MMPGTGPEVGPDRHPLTDQYLRIPTADRLRVEKSLFIDVLDQHANLVGVAGQHET